jgi:hypothetical protein
VLLLVRWMTAAYNRLISLPSSTMCMKLIELVVRTGVTVIVGLFSFVKWLPTPGGALLIFLLVGSGVALWGLREQPQGMEGNLVAEIAGAFFGAAAIDGILLILEHHQHRQRGGALRVAVEATSEGYAVELSNRSKTALFNIRLQGHRADWEWQEPEGWWTGSTATYSFADHPPVLGHLSRGRVRLLLKPPRGGGTNLPYWMVAEWDDMNGEHYIRRELLQPESPWDF